MRLSTVNVLEYFSDTVQSLHSFTDDEAGNKEAETLFTLIAKDNGFSDKDIEVGLEDGLIRDDYQLYIVHSYGRTLKATYTSVWDGGVEVTSACLYDPDTKTVGEIEDSEVEGVECLEDEYVTLSDGTVLREKDGVTFDY